MMQIMNMIYKRIAEGGRNWRQIYKVYTYLYVAYNMIYLGLCICSI